MSHVMDLPDTLAEIDRFKAALNEHFITYDPADVDEFVLHMSALKALEAGETTMQARAADGMVTLKTADVAQISGDIMGQIYARDFKMIDQSDMIVSLVPELPERQAGPEQRRRAGAAPRVRGRQGGVRGAGPCRGTPSPFITETATRVFKSVTRARDFKQKVTSLGSHSVIERRVRCLSRWRPAIAEQTGLRSASSDVRQRDRRRLHTFASAGGSCARRLAAGGTRPRDRSVRDR
jgi:hypothetical protein